MWMWVLVAVAVAFIVTVVHLRRSQKTAYENILKVGLADVDRLRQECEDVFQRAFSETLSLSEYEHSAKLLSDRLDNFESLKAPFAKEDFYWYFVLPVGAYIGELLRVHAKGQWRKAEDGGLKVEILVHGEPAITHPFDKVMKQVTVGDKGDLYAYFMTAMNLEFAVATQQSTESG